MAARAATSRGAKGAGVAILAVLLVPGLLYAFPTLTGSSGAFLVLSGSMEPTLAAGDVIFVGPPTAVAVGDVITFQPFPAAKTLVTHRVVEILESDAGPRYRTRGDANTGDDPWLLAPSQIIGEYRFDIPYWGLAFGVLKSKIGFVVLILVPAAIIIGREFVKLYRELDAMDRARQARKAAAKEESP
ncbi:MAG TPA: signal peptidase I [Candidatus Thermoplasmatota archaeon]|nr:signal peptidase I [Candidatus Thermoplasmatota archaeon]